MVKSVIVIPTYNEASNLALLAAEIWALAIPDSIILAVDDNSPDGTGQIADELTELHPDKFHALHQPEKMGLRAAYVAGFKWALARGAEAIIQMDCDFSHSPHYIPEMLARIKESDLVIGSRYVSGGEIDRRWGPGQYLLSWWANSVYTRLILKLNVQDATTGFKCWRASLLRQIDLDAVKGDGYSFQFEMTYLAEKLGCHIEEIPIYFEDRRIDSGSRLTLATRIKAVFYPWQLLWRYRQIERVVRPQER